jgi:rhamnulokinase
MKYYLAVDLKDSIGVLTIGELSTNTINLIDIGTFKNNPVSGPAGLCWDIEYIFSEVKKGISRAFKVFGENFVGIGVTAWGNDFGLLDEDGQLLQNPRCHYEQENDQLVETLSRLIPPEQLYEMTACHNSPISSLYQLLSIKKNQPEILSSAKKLLLIPDIINYRLSGIAASDQTIASTTQLYRPGEKIWATDLIHGLGFPSSIFPDIKPPGTVLGPLKKSLCEELGISHTPLIVLPGGHDSACALAAIPHPGGNFAYLSSGTWSILGTPAKKTITTSAARRGAFTNESGVDNTVNLLRVMRGHWALEQCQATWAKEDGKETSWETIADMALAGNPFRAVVDITDERFNVMGDMPGILRTYCKTTGQKSPETREDICRILMEGMVFTYQKTVEDLEVLTGQRIYSLQVAGSGARNYALNQFTANALNRRVTAGPFRAKAFGNLIMQMIAMGDVSTINEGKKLVKNSMVSIEYSPAGEDGWAAAYEKFLNLKKKTPSLANLLSNR